MSRRPSISQLAWLGVATWILPRAQKPISDNSFLWHVAAGRLQLGSGQVLTSDPFTYTFGGAAWRTQSWLIELMYGRLDAWFGFNYVPTMLAVSALVAALTLGVHLRRRLETEAAVVLLVLVSVVLLAPFWNPRPVFASYLLLTLLMVAMDDGRLRWSVPLLIWFWAGIHASWPLGLAYAGLRAFSGRTVARWAPPIAVGALLVGATAHGLGVIGFLRDFVGNSGGLGLIQEWAVPNLMSIDGVGLVVILALILRGAIAGRLNQRDLVVILPFLALGLTSWRALPVGGLALLTYAAGGVEVSGAIRHGSTRVGVIPAAALVALVALMLIAMSTPQGLDNKRFPIAAASHIGEGPLFHDDVVGGYLAYSRPDVATFIDDRVELFGREFLERFIGVRSGRTDWAPLFDQYGINQVLMRSDSPVVGDLGAAGWSTVYSDGDFTVLASE